MNEKILENFFKLIINFEKNLKFEIIEIGAHPYNNKEEPFYKLLDFFPESKINAFEIDKNECEKFNKNSKKNINYFPLALGEKDEKRKFYETNHPMCSSLYEPNEKLMALYNNLEVANLKNLLEIETTNLDKFLRIQNIEFVDFIKIDIQGAELDVFKGAEKCLKKTLFIVSEVEFISIYKYQPLFGEICSFLDKRDLMFHKFLGLAGRALRPVVLANNKNFASQHMWSDAVFIKNILQISKLTGPELLKLSVLSFLYGSPDLTVFCLLNYDKKNKSNLVELFRKIS
tara:strand:- start:908 stop:1768 length:861 start_codon:yes stop_codon:yes gene_type:complete